MIYTLVLKNTAVANEPINAESESQKYILIKRRKRNPTNKTLQKEPKKYMYIRIRLTSIHS